MTKGKVVTLFGSHIKTLVQPPADRDLFGSIHEMKGKVIFLNELDWHEDSLLSIIARNPIGAVIDIRSRPVFRLPRYRHRHVVSYFHKYGIQYLELANVLRDMPTDKRKIRADLTGLVFSRAEHGLIICFFDNDTKERGWINTFKNLMMSDAIHFVELHPRALAGANSHAGSGL